MSHCPNPINKNTLRIIHKYMLNIKNSFHLRAAQKIVDDFQPHKDPNYEIKLNSRMKVSLGRQLNLLPQHLLLPRREPVYLKGVIPLKTVLIMYGVDRMSNKDMNLFVYGEPLPEGLHKPAHEPKNPSNPNEVLEGLQQTNIPFIPKQKSLEITRLDTSHYGIVILNDEGKKILKKLFKEQKESIFNVLKEVQSENQENQLINQDPKINLATKKLPRGWFSIKPHQRSELCVRYATSTEYSDGKWTIITKPLQEDLICRVNIFANTLETRTHLQQEMDTLSAFSSRRSSRFISGQNHLKTSLLNCGQQKNHFIKAAQQIFGKKKNQQKEKLSKEQLSKLKEDKDEEDLSERLSKMSCDDKPKNQVVDQMDKQNIFQVSAEKVDKNQQKNKRKDSEMISQGEIDMNELFDTRQKIEIIRKAQSNVMVDQSSQNHEATTGVLRSQKLINSFNEINTKHTLANHPDIYKIKKIQKYRVNPSSKFNYSRYNAQRQLEQRLQRRKIKIRRRQVKDLGKAAKKMIDENQSIPIVNLISDDQGPILKIGKDIPSTSGNEEFEVMDGMPIPQYQAEDTILEQIKNFPRRTEKKIIVHYERKMSPEKSFSPKSNQSKGSKSPYAEKRKAFSKIPGPIQNKDSRLNHSQSIASKKAQSIRKNSSKGSVSPPSRKNQHQSKVKQSSPFFFANRDETSHNSQQKPQEQRRNNRLNNDYICKNQNRFSGNERGNFDLRNERPNQRRNDDGNGNGQKNFQRGYGENRSFQRRDGQNGGFQRRDGQNGGFQRRNDQNVHNGQNERKNLFDRNNENSKSVERKKNIKAEESDEGVMDY